MISPSWIARNSWSLFTGDVGFRSGLLSVGFIVGILWGWGLIPILSGACYYLFKDLLIWVHAHGEVIILYVIFVSIFYQY